MNFTEQYKHPEWQKKRLEILNRDDFQCQSCMDTETTLNVHHKYYTKDKKLWEYDDDCFTTLCENCHSDIHNYIKESKSIIDIFSFSIDWSLEVLELLRIIEKLSITELAALIKICKHIENGTTSEK